MDPDDADDLANRGEALRMLRRYADAIRDFDAAYALQPRNWYLGSKGAALADSGQPVEAEAVLRQALEKDARYVFARGVLAKALIAQEREPEARALARDLLVENAEDVIALEALAHACYGMDEVEEGLQALERLLVLQPDSAWGRGLMGAMLCRIAEYARAADELRRSVALDGGQPWVLGARAFACRMLAARAAGAEAVALAEEALASDRLAVDRDPADTSAIAALGESLWRLGRRQEACEQFTRALDLARESPAVDFWMAKNAGWAALRLAWLPQGMDGPLLEAAERYLVDALAKQRQRSESLNAIEVMFSLALVILCSGRYGLAFREYDSALAAARRRAPRLARGLIEPAAVDLREALQAGILESRRASVERVLASMSATPSGPADLGP
jgi:tetratricopeptide (TPR) repeat protein